MTTKLSNSLIILLGLLFLFFLLYLFPTHQEAINQIAGHEVQSLDARFSYTQDDVVSLFETVKEEGRQKMKFISGVIDMVYPLVYGGFFFMLLSRLTTNFSNNKLKNLRFLPLIGMLFDYIENFSVLNMLKSFPSITETQVMISSSATFLKWGFLNIALLLIVALAGQKLFTKLKK